MFTLMDEPVILPSSRITMDKATIRSHLLSDPNDPFNRSPLEIEDVIPGKLSLDIRIAPLPARRAKLTYRPADTEMKAKIEAFKNEKKSAARAPITGLTNDEMDTSAG